MARKVDFGFDVTRDPLLKTSASHHSSGDVCIIDSPECRNRRFLPSADRLVTRGHKVRLPVESLISFRLDPGLNLTGADRGTMKEGHHYHGYYRDDRY